MKPSRIISHIHIVVMSASRSDERTLGTRDKRVHVGPNRVTIIFVTIFAMA
jgi:hypothetical protein